MRKRTRRKHYALVNPILFAIEGARITPEKELNRLRVRELASIDAFAHGHAGLSEWSDLCHLMNLAEHMARAGIGPEVLETCAAVQAHLIDAKERYERTKRMGTTGLGLQSFRELYELHDLQRQSISRSEYERHLTKMVNRVRSKAPDVVVLT